MCRVPCTEYTEIIFDNKLIFGHRTIRKIPTTLIFQGKTYSDYMYSISIVFLSIEIYEMKKDPLFFILHLHLQ